MSEWGKTPRIFQILLFPLGVPHLLKLQLILPRVLSRRKTAMEISQARTMLVIPANESEHLYLPPLPLGQGLTKNSKMMLESG